MPFDNVTIDSEVTSILRKIEVHFSDRRNWCQNYNNSWGRVCMVGAVNRFVPYHKNYPLNKAVVCELASTTPSNLFQETWTARAKVKSHNDDCNYVAVMQWLARTIEQSQLKDCSRY